MEHNDKIAFMVHPVNVEGLYFILGRYLPFVQRMPLLYLKNLIRKLPPFEFLNIKGIKSITGKTVDVVIVVCPLLPEHFVAMPQEVVINKILRGAQISQELGAKILSLGGFTSIFSNQGLDICNRLDMAITTGNSYTASLVIEAILKASNFMNIDLSKSSLTILGGTGDIGKACAQVLGRKVNLMNLIARDQDALADVRRELEKVCSARINIGRLEDKYLENADIIICSTSSITTLIDSQELKRGALLCDVSLPPNVARNIKEKRKDVFAFEGGYARLPFYNEIDNVVFKKYFIHENIFGCLAEAVILALEGDFVNYSLGRGNITIEKMNHINLLGKKHGIQLAPFFCSHQIFQDDDLRAFLQAIN